jgi:branched-chain amino acid transport system ATP-binding protein
VTVASTHDLIATVEIEARHGLLAAVRSVSLRIREGEIVALVGANGAGKTTLLRTIAGAHPPSAGRVFLDGTDVTSLRAHERARAGVALVPEGRRLFANLTVEENLRVAGRTGRVGPWSYDRVLEAFPMLVPLLKRRSGDLSGGQQQATAIGRALMTNPRALLLDEVSLGLSPHAVDVVYDSLKTVIASGATIVLVEQDLARAMHTATRVVCMLEGRIALDVAADSVARETVTEAYFGLRRGEARAS